MTPAQVKALFPRQFVLKVSTTAIPTPWVQELFSEEDAHRVFYYSNEDEVGTAVMVYFSTNDTLVGFWYSASNGPDFDPQNPWARAVRRGVGESASAEVGLGHQDGKAP